MTTTGTTRDARATAPPGAATCGHVVTAASRAHRRELGVDEPTTDLLLTAQLHLGRTPVAAASKLHSGLLFALGRALDEDATVFDAARAVEHVAPAVEVVGEGGARAVAPGTAPARLDAVDLRLAGCLVHRNGEIAETGAGGVLLGSPLEALVWLARTGARPQAGQLVLVSSMTRAVPVGPGDTAVVSVAGLGVATARLVPAAEEVR